MFIKITFKKLKETSNFTCQWKLIKINQNNPKNQNLIKECTSVSNNSCVTFPQCKTFKLPQIEYGQYKIHVIAINNLNNIEAEETQTFTFLNPCKIYKKINAIL